MRIVYIISDIDKSLGFEWTASWLKKTTDIHYILIGKDGTHLEKHLVAEGIPFKVISDEKYPNNILKFIRVSFELWEARPDAVHCHMWRANLIGLSCAWLLRVPKRIYTRHHSMIHYREFPKGRKWDMLCNYLSTKIVAISENVRKVLLDLEHVPPSKIATIHHGFDLTYFSAVEPSRTDLLKEKYNLRGKGPFVGVVSRYLELKGIQYTIPAFAEIRKEFPQAHLILANARGDYGRTVKLSLAELPIGSYTEISFEEDLAALYSLMDVHVHVPIDRESEAFGQTYVEALASGVPSVFTLSGVAPEFIRHEQNALVVDFKDIAAIHKGVKRILTDSHLKQALIENGKASIQDFSSDKMILALQKLYSP